MYYKEIKAKKNFIKKIKKCVEYRENQKIILIIKNFLGKKIQYVIDKETGNVIFKVNINENVISLLNNTNYFCIYDKKSKQKSLYNYDGKLIISDYKKVDYLNKFTNSESYANFIIVDCNEDKYVLLTQKNNLLAVTSCFIVNKSLIVLDENKLKVYDENFKIIDSRKISNDTKVSIKKVDFRDESTVSNNYFSLCENNGFKITCKLYKVCKERIVEIFSLDGTVDTRFSIEYIIDGYVIVSNVFKNKLRGKILYNLNNPHFIPSKYEVNIYKEYRFYEVFNNIYIIAIGNNLTNVLDKNGNKIFGGEYTKLQILNGYIYIKQGNLNGIASLKGEILIKPIKSKIFETSETFYYIDEQKNKIVVKK